MKHCSGIIQSRTDERALRGNSFKGLVDCVSAKLFAVNVSCAISLFSLIACCSDRPCLNFILQEIQKAESIRK